MNIEQIMRLADEYARPRGLFHRTEARGERAALESALREALAPQPQEPDCGHESCDCRTYCKKEKP